ncbi:hypothetical protein [Blastopirellula marina]|uniref:Uncharacterized protein n=1 Tax=Blastopirellula marina TaxID=124 RepID=A0A2S8GMG8_9BACT|nr:hypothetical protein [Blastopirellula marina]PQO45214.1 hypothetical protein C5Y93_14720 [Blastopirellula marina]
MDFFDASTLSPEEREWVRPEKPVTVPSASLLLMVMTYLSVSVCLGLVGIHTLEISYLPALDEIVIRGLLLSWFAVMALLQYLAVFQRSQIATLLLLLQMIPVVIVETLVGLLNMLRFETHVWMAVASFSVLLPSIGLAMLLYDWLHRLRYYYKNHKERRPMFQFSLQHVFLFMVACGVMMFVVQAYHHLHQTGQITGSPLVYFYHFP